MPSRYKYEKSSTQSVDYQRLYDDLFRLNSSSRTEWGNNEASFTFFMEQAFKNDISILEIGGNIGTLAHRIFEAGYKNIYSTDIAPSAIAYGKSVYPELRDRLLVASQGQLPFPAHSFDLVMSFDVVEHLPDVDAHFQEVKRLLKADGRYIFQTPNKITNIPWEIIDSRSLSEWKTLHCSLHTRGQLARRIENNGFRGAILKRNLATEYNQEKIRNRLGVAGLSLLKLVDRLPAQFSTNFWVVCSPVENDQRMRRARSSP